jgi:hypothetical protein
MLRRVSPNGIFGDAAPKIDRERGHWWLAWAADAERDIAGFASLTPTFCQREVGYRKRAGVRLLHRGRGLQAHA